MPLGGGVKTPSEYYTQVAWSLPHQSATGRPDGWQAAVTHRTPYDYPYAVNAWVVCAQAGQVTLP